MIRPARRWRRSAAGWADTLSLAEIAAELEQGDELLATQAGDVPARHRSVRAVCDATWARLMSQEQAVFAQVAIFRGGGTRRALQAVTGASLGQLHALVGKALLRYDPERERYAVHELLRQYAEERLGHDPAAGQVAHARHATYYLEALAARQIELKGAGQRAALDWIGREIENVHAAWGWAVAEGRADLLAPAAISLGCFLEWQGRHAEGLAAFRQASEGLTRCHDPDMRAALILTLAWCAAFHRALGQRDAERQALDRAETLLAEAVKPDDTHMALEALLTLQFGHSAANNDFQAAHSAYTRSLQAARAAGDPWMEAQALTGLGEAYHSLASDYVEAARCWEDCLRLQRAHADQLGAIVTLGQLSMNARYRGHLNESLALARESYNLARSVGTLVQRSNAALHLGFAYHWLAQLDAAIPFLEEALQLETEFGNLDRRGQALMALGSGLSLAGRYPQATDLLERALTISRQIGNTVNEHATLIPLVWTALGAREYDRGRRYLAEAIPLLQERGAHHHLALLLGLGAMLERKIGNRAQARRLCLAALHESMTYRIWLGLHTALWAVALLLTDEGAVERAIELMSLTEYERVVPRDQVGRDIFWTEMDALLATLPVDVAAAARERGRQRGFWATGQELLGEVETAGWGE
jgi:tetratricopeptide (TPR) repeat protein